MCRCRQWRHRSVHRCAPPCHRRHCRPRRHRRLHRCPPRRPCAAGCRPCRRIPPPAGPRPRPSPRPDGRHVPCRSGAAPAPSGTGPRPCDQKLSTCCSPGGIGPRYSMKRANYHPITAQGVNSPAAVHRHDGTAPARSRPPQRIMKAACRHPQQSGNKALHGDDMAIHSPLCAVPPSCAPPLDHCIAKAAAGAQHVVQQAGLSLVATCHSCHPVS